MKQTRNITHLLMLALLTSCAGVAARVHPIAGVRVQSDPMMEWFTVHGPDDGYSFSTPGRPSSYRPSKEDGTASDVEIHDLRLENNSRGYSVEVFARPKGDDQSVSDQFEQLLRARAVQVESVEPNSPSGAARVITYQLPSTHVATSHVFLTPDRVFVLTAISLFVGSSGLVKEDARFFASLTVKGRRMTQ